MSELTDVKQKEFHNRLVNSIKAVGLDIYDNAESLIGDTPLLSSLTITINFDPEFNCLCPTINVNKNYLSKRTIMTDRLPVLNNFFYSDRSCLIKDTIDIGFGELNILRNSKNIFATDRIVEYSCKEMTIEEIQEKLGYKVKIVDKRGKN